MPQLLLLLTLGIRLEDLKQVLALIDLSVSIGVHNLSKILHESEVTSHLVSQPSHLAQFRNQCDLVASLSVFVDQQGLIWLSDILIVSGLVVLLV